jgi:hypothetical protein
MGYRHFPRIVALLTLTIGMAACGQQPTSTAAPVAVATSPPASTATAVPPTATPAPTAPATPTATPEQPAKAPPATSAFKLEKRAVWETTVSPDALQGDCPDGSIVPPYGPVLITPTDGGFEWKDVQNAVYGFAATSDGGFRYAGPNGRKDGLITMTLTFVDAQSFTMQADYVKTNTPACLHRFDYKGAFKFER